MKMMHPSILQLVYPSFDCFHVKTAVNLTVLEALLLNLQMKAKYILNGIAQATASEPVSVLHLLY